jgi:hypothetical protein
LLDIQPDLEVGTVPPIKVFDVLQERSFCVPAEANEKKVVIVKDVIRREHPACKEKMLSLTKE